MYKISFRPHVEIENLSVEELFARAKKFFEEPIFEIEKCPEHRYQWKVTQTDDGIDVCCGKCGMKYPKLESAVTILPRSNFNKVYEATKKWQEETKMTDDEYQQFIASNGPIPEGSYDYRDI